jgi:diamine N-acetyltransferase
MRGRPPYVRFRPAVIWLARGYRGDVASIRVGLQLTQASGLHRFIEAEMDPDTRCWLGEVSFGWHQGVLAAADMEHLSIVGDAGQVAGFAVLAGLGRPDIELRRIVVLPECRSEGIGAAALAAVVDRVFDVHGANRVWLDVKVGNHRARRLYEWAGFAVCGELPDALAEPDGTLTSLLLMSMHKVSPGGGRVQLRKAGATSSAISSIVSQSRGGRQPSRKSVTPRE